MSPPKPEEQEAFKLVLRHHNAGAPESDVRIAFIAFLEKTGIAGLDEMYTERPPGPFSRDRVDLYVHNTCIEFKKDIMRGGTVNQEDLGQLDNYIKQLVKAGVGVQNGILTDGVNYQIRRIGDDTLPLTKDIHHVFDLPQQAPRVREYLYRVISAAASDISPTEGHLTRHFGINSDVFRSANTLLTDAHRANRDQPTVAVKRKLWQELLQVALGQDSLADDASNDWLYIRHTYLTTLVSIIVQAQFGINVTETDPVDLLNGSELYRHTNLKGIIDSDLFSWPLEVNQTQYITAIAHQVARFDWSEQFDDLAAILYQNTITPEERNPLGEYYTPRWLARAIVSEAIADPASTKMLDPACGSGTFIEASMRHLLANVPKGSTGEAKLSMLQRNVAGIDLHPVAVQLAKATWVMNARQTISDARAENRNLSDIIAPIHLGDSMQLRYDNSLITAQGQITLSTGEILPGQDDEVVFEVPLSLAQDSERFDNLMIDIAESIDGDSDAAEVLSRYQITDEEHRSVNVIVSSMQQLHAIDRDHIWAYYLRNMTRPAVIATDKVDAIIGNPPWLTYKESADIIRDELHEMSEKRYSIWAGGKNSANQDVASLFYVRSAELYLKEGGTISMVMPHSTLRSEQHSKFRTGQYIRPGRGRGKSKTPAQAMGLDFSLKVPWDLDNLKPEFFPMPSSVIFARLTNHYGTPPSELTKTGALTPGAVEVWSGATGTRQVKRTKTVLHHDDGEFHSPYADYASRGADIFDRRLYFVIVKPNTTILAAPGTYLTYPQPGSQDKKKYSVGMLNGVVLHEDYLFDVYLGETLAPFVALSPRKAVLPVDRQTMIMPLDHSACDRDEETGRCKYQNCTVDRSQLDQRMAHRWELMENLWTANKGKNDPKSLTQNLNFLNKMLSQLDYLQRPSSGFVRIAYTAIGRPTAALIVDNKSILDTALYQVVCRNKSEAYYLLSIINSNTLARETKPFCTTNWAKEIRNLHKHLWKLPIPRYSQENKLHTRIARLGRKAEAEAYKRIADMEQTQKGELTVKAARDELRNYWQRPPKSPARKRSGPIEFSETTTEIEVCIAELLGLNQ